MIIGKLTVERKRGKLTRLIWADRGMLMGVGVIGSGVGGRDLN